MSDLNRKEQILFDTLKNEIMQTLSRKVDDVLKKSILELRGKPVEVKKEQIKNTMIESFNYEKKDLEI